MQEPAPARAWNRSVVLVALAATALTAIVYGGGLAHSPLYLTKDEVSYAIQSDAIANTGHDVNGNRLPLFFQEPGFDIGRDPIYIYATAALLQVQPLNARTLRLPTVVAGALAVGLVVLVAYEMYGSLTLAMLAGVLLAVTPVFFIRSRAALAVILPVPFQLLWLLFLLRYSRSGRLHQLLIGVGALGVGMYSYLAMLLFAPVHLLFSLAQAVLCRRWRHAVMAVALFAVLLMPLAVWQRQHPGRVDEMTSSYRVYPAGLTPLQGLKDVLSWSSLAVRSDLYWNAFNPSRLFFSGESSLVDSTRTAGLYPAVYLFLLPLGLYDFVRRPITVVRLAALSMFLIGPIPGALVGRETISRYLIVSPLAALLAVGGLQRLWRTRWPAVRVTVPASVLTSIVMFGGFYSDYMGGWRIRSAMYLGGNLQGAMERVLTMPSGSPDLVFLSERIPYVNVFWEYYRRAHHRDDLIGRDRGLRLQDGGWRQPGGRAVAIVPGGDDTSASEMKAAGWSVVAEIYEFYGGRPSFVVLSRN